MNFFVTHQLNFMMLLGGICGFIFLFLLFMKIDNRNKKISFLQIAFFSMLLLISDRFAYIYRGDESTLGYWMVRICNFLVYASILLVLYGFNNYLLSFVNKNKISEEKTLNLGRLLVIIGLTLLVISQFTGLYYTIDATNRYQRSDGFIICYLMPLIITAIQFVFIIKNRSVFRKQVLYSLLVFVAFPIIAGVVQIFFYGLSLTSISIAISSIIIYFYALSDQNQVLVVAVDSEKNKALEIQKTAKELLNQTVEALASAVDAKDTYTHGHSNRVAKYAKEIAEMSGMSKKECEDIYLAGLLHDVGKIGIRDDIINKKGTLTNDEFAIIKQHPVLGAEILSKILISPSLSVGARHHHERYDGRGYPDKLKGEDIPNIARIIAVADAYDAMTSKRSYRDMIPRMYVREELVKGSGTQFDPEYAKIMLHLLDLDEEYEMKENRSEEVFGADLSYEFTGYRSKVSAGIRITDCPVSIDIRYKPLKRGGLPILLFYDSADARYYLEDNSLSEEMDFIEFAGVDMGGKVFTDYVRKVKQDTTDKEPENMEADQPQKAHIRMVKQEDHLQVTISTKQREDEIIFALYDASRYLYLALTGEQCSLDILNVDIDPEPVAENYIPRIAEKISYIDKPVGDIPNLQIDGWKSNHSEMIDFTESMEICFHTMSLPSSRRVWHCPIIMLFISDDENGYREISSVRLDGEGWCDNAEFVNTTSVSKGEDFENWSLWKQKNKAGVGCRLKISRKGNVVNLLAENGGLTTINQTKLPNSADKIYCCITGDQCAITDIHIKKA